MSKRFDPTDSDHLSIDFDDELLAHMGHLDLYRSMGDKPRHKSKGRSRRRRVAKPAYYD